MIPGSANPLLLLATAAPTGYNIERSLRFNSSDSAYLGPETFSSPTSSTAWTWAGWIKKTLITTSTDYRGIFTATSAADNYAYLDFSDNGIRFANRPPSGTIAVLQTTPVFRDPSAWFHLVFVFDSANATSTDTLRLYINGTRVTTFSSATYPSASQASIINSAVSHYIGYDSGNAAYLDGYLADIHFIDGQALDPTSFGEFDANGIWQPIAYSGTYGTNGFHLPFSDNSTAAALGTDTSGNSNTWTVNNISVAAGAGNDSLVDSPTNGTQTDTGAGGEVVGNYCTWNPLLKAGGDQTYTNGNLDVNTGSVSAGRVVGTIGVSSSKWYWEVVKTAGSGGQLVGIVAASENLLTEPGSTANGYSYYSSGQKYTNATLSSYGASWTTNDVIGIALDLDAGTLVFYKNGVSQGTAFTGISGTFVPAVSDDNSGSGNSTTAVANFGQRPFAYTAPSGFKALCTANLPTPTIADGSTAMDVKLYTGNGSTQTISGLNFDPDLVWIKERSGAADHALYDTVRTATKQLESNTTTAETTESTGLTAFATGGFSLGALAQVNTNTDTYAAWCWDAGSSTATNTEGSITSTVRANASAGFSIVTAGAGGYLGGSVGHGLGVPPEFILAKDRNTTYGWRVYHKSTGNNFYFDLTTGAAANFGSNLWNVTSSVFGSNAGVSGSSLVAYCFAPVNGYSSFGSFVGTTSKPFVYLGFRPKLVMIKFASGGANTSYTSWYMSDSARDTDNPQNGTGVLWANRSYAEGARGDGTAGGSFLDVDFLSNGFRVLDTTNAAELNFSGATYVYAAWAESPFQYARAR